jgi:hypothetical protein
MNGIALDGPANGFANHEAVVFNTIIPSSCIKKKHMQLHQFPQDKRIGVA